jgi:voltage-gated potassium channel
MNDLERALLAAFVMVVATVIMHLVGLMGLIRLTQLHIKHFRTPWLALDRLLVPLGIATGLFALHGAEVWLYAAAYQVLHATHGWEKALYLSAGAYSTAGWPGVQTPERWRLLPALESLNGMLLLGWSTAFLFQTLHRILQTDEGHPLPEGAIAEEVEEELDGDGKDSPRPSRSGRGAPPGTNSSDTELMQ